MNQQVRNQALMGLCLVLALVVVVVSVVDGPSWITAVMALCAVLALVGVLRYRRRGGR